MRPPDKRTVIWEEKKEKGRKKESLKKKGTTAHGKRR